MKHLRLRLTALYTITAGLILTLAMAGFLMLRIRETRQEQLENFHSTWNTVVLRMQSDSMISQHFLAQTEAASQSVIHIEENGIPFLYQGSADSPPDADRPGKETGGRGRNLSLLCTGFLLLPHQQSVHH